jgi:hypothetical protein
VSEVTPEYRIVKRLASVLRFSPLAEFGGPPAVVDSGSFLHGQAEFLGRLLQSGHHGRDVDGLPAEKLFDRLSYLRRFRVEGKGDPLDLDPVFLFELFNTPGTEVAPGSDVVRKDFHYEGRFHVSYLQVIFGDFRSGRRWYLYFGYPSIMG